MANEPTSNPTQDEVSLEDLVRASSGPGVEEAVDNVDKVLQIEDPTFAAELQILKIQGATPEPGATVTVDADIDTILNQEKIEKASKGWRRLRLWLLVRPMRKVFRALATLKEIGPWLILTAWPAFKQSAAAAWASTKSGFSHALKKQRAGSAWYRRLSSQSKLLVLLVALFGVGAIAMVQMAYTGTFLPSLKKNFLLSYAPIADRTFTIAPDEPWEDLNDPLLHPEHIVLIERLIVNLRSTADSQDPMAMIDLFVEAGSKEAAIELKDREAEMRDMILRTMEQMTYDDLSSESGKSKLKVFVRKNLNDMMSRGRVRRVFYKSMVLKP